MDLAEECVMDGSDEAVLTIPLVNTDVECLDDICAFPDLVGRFIEDLEGLEMVRVRRQIDEGLEADNAEEMGEEMQKVPMTSKDCPDGKDCEKASMSGQEFMDESAVIFAKGIKVGKGDFVRGGVDNNSTVSLDKNDTVVVEAPRRDFSGEAVEPDCLVECEDAREEEVCQEESHEVKCSEKDRIVTEAVLKNKCEIKRVEECQDVPKKCQKFVEECIFKAEEVCDDDDDVDDVDADSEEVVCATRLVPKCEIVKQRFCRGFVPSLGIDGDVQNRRPFEVQYT